jgi:uncharacterized membrane protein (UPF0127 family)
VKARAGSLLAWSLAAAAALCCTASPAGSAAPATAGQKPRVVIRTATRELEVAVEVARTDEEHARGLMFRDRLGRDEGMLFVFQQEGEHVFWMKNTLIPLDMIFIDGLGNIAGILARAEPRTETPRSIGVPSRYVLEVAGGWAEEHGVKAGDKVLFRGSVSAPR